MAEQQQAEELEIIETPDGKPLPEDAEHASETDDEDSDVDDEDDEEEHSARSEADREAIRERRRAERANRKSKRKEFDRRAQTLIQSQQRIIDELNQRLSGVEQRTSGAEVAQLERAIQESNDMVEAARQAVQKAVETGDGAMLVKAQEAWYNYKRRSDELAGIKQNYTKQQSQPRNTPIQIDPVTKNNAEAWMSKNTWYNPQGQDVDSRIVLTLDNALAAEGFDPKTPEYWSELESRIGQYLPHRAKAAQRAKPKGVPTGGSGRDNSPTPGSANSKKVHLSSDRIKAIKEAGAWDDLPRRTAMVNAYLKYDKENGL